MIRPVLRFRRLRPAHAAAALLVAVAPLAAAPSTLAAQATAGERRASGTTSTTDDFQWSGTIARGAQVRVHNINGAILVEPATGDRLEITATKRVNRGSGERVRVELLRAGPGDADVVVCALWSPEATCDASGSHSPNRSRGERREDEVSVEFRVRLPAGVRISAGTVNGRVRVDGASAEVRASTVNGGIEAASTSGPVRASTVNGSIDVRMASLAGAGDIDYSTVNGTVKVRLPEGTDADVDLQTVNGSIESDFPLTMQGRIDRQHVRARLGKGGPRLTFRTVNGSVRLTRE